MDEIIIDAVGLKELIESQKCPLLDSLKNHVDRFIKDARKNHTSKDAVYEIKSNTKSKISEYVPSFFTTAGSQVGQLVQEYAKKVSPKIASVSAGTAAGMASVATVGGAAAGIGVYVGGKWVYDQHQAKQDNKKIAELDSERQKRKESYIEKRKTGKGEHLCLIVWLN